MKKIIVFDIDGVLVDSTERSVSSLCSIISRHGLEPEYNLIMANWGHSFGEILIPALASAGNWPEYKMQLIIEDAKCFFEDSTFGGPMGLKEKLETLKFNGYELGTLTNRDDRMAQKALAELGLDETIFDFQQTADSGFKKPDPRVFNYFLKYYEATEIVFVGDSIICDLPAAYGCRPIIDFIGITSMIHRREHFVAAGVPENMIYNSVIEIIDELIIDH